MSSGDSEKADHRVEVVTRNGDRLTRWVTADEAREYDDLPFDDAANIASTTITTVEEQ